MQELNFSVLLWWYAIMGLTMTTSALTVQSVMSGSTPAILHYTPQQYVLLICAGICSSLQLCCDTIAYQQERSTTVSLLEYI
jgi:EamA domain-containing membrane protein RarD